MKRILALFAALAAFVSCVEADLSSNEALDMARDVKFDIKVGDLEPATRAIKKTWADGDKINIWFNGSYGQEPDLVMTYDASSGWSHGDVREGVTFADGQKMLALYEASNNLSGYSYGVSASNDGGVFTAPASVKKAGCYARPTYLTVSSSQTYGYAGSTVSADLTAWEFQTKVQVVVSGLDRSDGSQYAMRCDHLTQILTMTVQDDNTLGIETQDNTNSYPVFGVPNADGLAFCFLDTDSRGTPADYVFTITKLTPNGEGGYTTTTQTYTAEAKTLTTSSAMCKSIIFNASDSKVEVQSVTMENSSEVVAVGGYLQLEATVVPENATFKGLSWTSDTPSVATVSSTGLVKGIKGGFANIVASSKDNPDISFSCYVQVDDYIPVDGISLMPVSEDNPGTERNLTLYNPSINYGYRAEYRVNIEVSPKNASNTKRDIVVSDPSVVEVKEVESRTSGLFSYDLVPKKEGSATITFKSNDDPDLSVSLTANVAQSRVTGISFSGKNDDLSVGATDVLYANVNPLGAYDHKVEWSISDPSVVNITQYGDHYNDQNIRFGQEAHIVALKAGSATITATTHDGGFVAQRTINVVDYKPVTWLYLYTTEVELPVGTSLALDYAVNSDATNKNVIWTTSDPSIIQLGEYGRFTCRKLGTATITCTSVDGEHSATCTVTCATKGKLPVLESAGRPDNESGWVQLWEDGPAWAEFNVGATIGDYGALVETSWSHDLKTTTGAKVGYWTENVGGLYFWRNAEINRRYTLDGEDEYGEWWVDDDIDGIPDVPLVSQAHWGDNWTTPTREMWKPIIDAINGEGTKVVCTWCDGVNVKYCPGCTLAGYKISGTPGTIYASNSIFLPATGYFYDGELGWAGSSCSYWSSTYWTWDSGWGYANYDLYSAALQANKAYMSEFRGNSYKYGYAVRPVFRTRFRRI